MTVSLLQPASESDERAATWEGSVDAHAALVQQAVAAGPTGASLASMGPADVASSLMRCAVRLGVRYDASAEDGLVTPQEDEPGSGGGVCCKASDKIIAGRSTQQERNYWCGPATMQMVDRGDDGTRESQSTWSAELGTQGRRATGGYFTGAGGNRFIHIFEPYDQARLLAGAPTTWGPQAVQVYKLRQATQAHSMQNIGL